MREKVMNSSDKKISVILPVKDGDMLLLRRAVRSVLQQRGVIFEILLMDDGSGESVSKELDVIAAEDSRIRLIHMEGRGVSAARNRAFREAQGQIVTWLDCDDAVAPGCFAEAMHLLEDPSVDALWGGTCFVNAEEMEELLAEGQDQDRGENESAEKCCIPLDHERLHRTRAECIGEPYRFEGGGYINRGIAARFIRKDALEGHGLYFPEGIGMYEDTIWNLEMMECLSIRYVPRIWYYYYDNSASASNRFHADGLERIEEPLNRIRNILDLDNEEEYTAYTRFLMDSLRYVCQTMYLHPDWKPEPNERTRIKRHLYGDAPWNEIGKKRFLAHAEKRDRLKAVMYKMRLLLKYWSMVG